MSEECNAAEVSRYDIDDVMVALIGINCNKNVPDTIKRHVKKAIKEISILSPSRRRGIRREASINRKFFLKYLIERDGKRCVFCGTTDGAFHIDHIKPVSLGGDNSFDNLQLLCEKCNLAKSNKWNKEVWL